MYLPLFSRYREGKVVIKLLPLFRVSLSRLPKLWDTEIRGAKTYSTVQMYREFSVCMGEQTTDRRSALQCKLASLCTNEIEFGKSEVLCILKGMLAHFLKKI